MGDPTFEFETADIFDREDMEKVFNEINRNLDGDGCSLTVLLKLRREY